MAPNSKFKMTPNSNFKQVTYKKLNTLSKIQNPNLDFQKSIHFSHNSLSLKYKIWAPIDFLSLKSIHSHLQI
ncbi:hypothetical protein Hanom_Chr06g00529241 [Helianthus anomalus]